MIPTQRRRPTPAFARPRSSQIDGARTAGVQPGGARPRCWRIAPERLARHLGLPPGAALSDEWNTLISETQAWCNECLRPWLTTRRLAINEIAAETVSLEGRVSLYGKRLAEGLRGAAANAVIVAGFSVGPGLDREIASCWSTGRPDRALALHAMGASLVERMRDDLWLRLRRSLRGTGITVLPHLSPGYDGWPLSDQATLYALISRFAGPIELLASGGLNPLHSTLALFGLTAAREIVADENYWELLRDGCVGAEASFHPAREPVKRSAIALSDRPAAGVVVRLRVEDPGAFAAFRAQGPTCGKLGLRYALDCHVELERDVGDDWTIVSTRCQPAAAYGISGTCGYRQRHDFSRILAASGPAGRVRMAAAIEPFSDRTSFVCPCRAAGRRHIWRAALAAISVRMSADPKIG